MPLKTDNTGISIPRTSKKENKGRGEEIMIREKLNRDWQFAKGSTSMMSAFMGGPQFEAAISLSLKFTKETTNQTKVC